MSFQQVKHYSPGPWEVYPIAGNSPESGHVQVCQPSTKEYGAIAQVWGKGNARLIAAAPELLEALQTCQQLANKARQSHFSKAEAEACCYAIAKLAGTLLEKIGGAK